MKAEILKLLREGGHYVSGQEICEQLGVSRTAVWKVINQLKDDGYEIEAVRNKGYLLTKYPDVLSKEEVESLVATVWAGKRVTYYEKTDSTNVRAKLLAEQGADHGMLVITEMQEGGKGRRGRNWVSPKGENIYMSLLLRPQCAPSAAPMLTLVMAYSVAQTIIECEHLDVRIKWPNDIVLCQKKICGILTEMSAEIDYINHVVIGVGINANMETVDEELKDKATSLFIEGRKTVRRAKLIAGVMKSFERNYNIFLETGDLSQIQGAYNQLLVNREQEVTVLEPGSEYEGLARGINEHGELMVQKKDGTLEHVFAGEVSVRGINGYV